MKEIYRQRLPETQKETEKLSLLPFYTNSTLTQIVSEIPKFNASLEEVNKIARENGQREFDKIKDRKKSLGTIAEYHLYYALDSLKRFFPNINLSPIENDAQKDRFKFKKNGINYQVFWGHNSDSCEYDILSEIDNLPVIWEVKLGKLNGATSNRRISKILKPLISHYRDTKFGYVIVTPKDFITDHPEFEQRGGLIVPLYSSQEKFSEDICSVPEVKNSYTKIFDAREKNC